jgi:uncharacterized protein
VADPLLIVGASGRAAAASALRAGFTPHVLDLFADADTQQLGEVHVCPIPDYPQRLPELCRQFPPMPWMFTGGLENHPPIIEEISQVRDFFGCNPANFSKHRSPAAFHALISSAGFRTPAIASSAESYFPGKELPWLVKQSSSGGFGVRRATPTDFESLPEGAVRQRDVSGVPMSALFVAATHNVMLLGVTKQLIGEAWLHAPEFRYAGNIDITRFVSQPLLEELERLGESLWRQLKLLGLFGVDFLLARDEPWFLELNPRFTAGLEVLEQEWPTSAVGLHVEAFSSLKTPKAPIPSPQCHGKAIYYAKEPLRFPDVGPWEESLEDVLSWSPFADIPTPGTDIAVSQPVFTLRAQGRTERDCEAQLKALAAELDETLFPAPPSG